jgi:hypothetical protein
MAKGMTWSTYVELQSVTVQKIINSFDTLRVRKKQLVENINKKIAREPFDEVAELKCILDEELKLLTSAISQINYFLNNPKYFKKALQRSKFNKLTNRIWAALGNIFGKLRSIKSNITNESLGLLKCIGDKDFFHYNAAFEIPTGKKKCPYETEQELYGEIDKILEKEKSFITEILTAASFNLRSIFRRGTLPIVTAVIVAIGTLIANSTNEVKPSQVTSKTSIKKQTLPSTQKATAQLSGSSITPKGKGPFIRAKRGHTVSTYFGEYKKASGRLSLREYVKKFIELNGTDKLKIGNIYQLPHL